MTASSLKKKSKDAFRTISEAAEELNLPSHVLRFWESKFSQISPVKRAGGRRYYRPDDIKAISQIKKWLYDDGYTIKGVQKILKDDPNLKNIKEPGLFDDQLNENEAVDQKEVSLNQVPPSNNVPTPQSENKQSESNKTETDIVLKKVINTLESTQKLLKTK